MKDLEKELEKSVGEIIIDLQREIRELEEENKKLEDEIKDLVERNIELDKKYMLVLTENRKLKNYINLIEGTVRFKDV